MKEGRMDGRKEGERKKERKKRKKERRGGSLKEEKEGREQQMANQQVNKN